MTHVRKNEDSGGKNWVGAEIDEFDAALGRNVVLEFDKRRVVFGFERIIDSRVFAHLRYFWLLGDDHYDECAHGEHADRRGKAQEVDALAAAKGEENAEKNSSRIQKFSVKLEAYHMLHMTKFDSFLEKAKDFHLYTIADQ